MNIFAVEKTPFEAALALDDRRVRLQLAATSIMMSTAIYSRQSAPGLRRLTALDLNKIDHPTQTNAPLMKWVRQSSGNYRWVWQHYECLMNMCVKYLDINVDPYMNRWRQYGYSVAYMPTGPMLPLRNLACNRYYGLDYTNISDTQLAYRMYLSAIWAIEKRGPRPPTWAGRCPPEWKVE